MADLAISSMFQVCARTCDECHGQIKPFDMLPVAAGPQSLVVAGIRKVDVLALSTYRMFGKRQRR